MKKIIIAIDSFKGCLTSAEAGKAAEKGIKSINPSCHTSVIPIADGGEGLLDVLITATKGKYNLIGTWTANENDKNTLRSVRQWQNSYYRNGCHQRTTSRTY